MAKTPKLQRLISFRLDDIEGLFRQGWTYEMVVDSLITEGIEITPKYFSQCLAIARAKRKKEKDAKPEGSAVAPAAVEAPAGGKGGATNQRPSSPAPPKKPSAQGKFQMRTLDKDELF